MLSDDYLATCVVIAVVLLLVLLAVFSLAASAMPPSSSSIPSHARRLVEIYHKKLAPNSFARTLGSETASIVSLTKRGSSFAFTVPARLCVNNALSTSATMAIFDDLSTIGFMGADVSCRAGVSIHLSTQLLHSVAPGSKVVLRTTVDKIGRIVGFCSMELLLDNNAGGDQKEVVVARGKHIKFLPTGNWFVDNVIGRPGILGPVLTHLLNDDGTTLLHRLGLAKTSKPREYTCGEGASAAFEFFDMKPVTSDAARGKSVQTFKVQPFLCNFLGSLHGGAVGMATEWAALHCPEGQARVGKGDSVTSLEVVYLSGLAVGNDVEVEAGEQGGQVRRAGAAQPSMQFSIGWSKLALASSN